jgi:hypothetical protein
VTGCGGTLTGNAYVTAPISGQCSVNATFTKTKTDVVVTGRTKGGGGSFELGTLLLGALLVAMRRFKRVVALAGLMTATANAADFDTPDFYAGASIGQAASSASASDLTRHLHSAGYDVDVSMDDDRIGWRVFAGWTLNRYFAIEGGYTDLGEVKTGYTGTIAELDVPSLLNEAASAHPRSAKGYDGSIVIRYPFGPRWSVSADVGAFFWDAERRVHDSAGRSASKDDDGVDARYGLSVDANVFGNFDVIASWSRFELDSEHIDLTGLGLRYRW